jgi:hypothetical protein
VHLDPSRHSVSRPDGSFQAGSAKKRRFHQTPPDCALSFSSHPQTKQSSSGRALDSLECSNAVLRIHKISRPTKPATQMRFITLPGCRLSQPTIRPFTSFVKNQPIRLCLIINLRIIRESYRELSQIAICPILTAQPAPSNTARSPAFPNPTCQLSFAIPEEYNHA